MRLGRDMSSCYVAGSAHGQDEPSGGLPPWSSETSGVLMFFFSVTFEKEIKIRH